MSEYEPYTASGKRKNEDRVTWGEWLVSNWGCLVIVIICVIGISVFAWIIYDSNNKANNQALYTDNATDITATCLKQTTYAGDLLDCLYAKGFALVYHERPVKRAEK